MKPAHPKKDPPEDPRDAVAKAKIAVLEGHYGADLQFAAMQARTVELVHLAFDFYRIIPASGACVVSGQQPLISSAS